MIGDWGALGSQAPGLGQFSVMRGLRGGLHSWESDLTGAPGPGGGSMGCRQKGSASKLLSRGRGDPGA